MSGMLKELNPTILVLVVVMLIAIASTLFGLIIWFIKRLITGVDSQFKETNKKLDSTAEKCDDVLAEVSAAKDAFSGRMQQIQGTMESRALDIAKAKERASQAVEQCKRLDGRIQKTETEIEEVKDDIAEHDKRITLVERLT